MLNFENYCGYLWELFAFILTFGGLQFQSNPGIVTCLDNNPHKLVTGQFVTLREINGMTCLNGSTHKITGKSVCNTFV